MNVVTYLFNESKNSSNDLLLNIPKPISYKQAYQQIFTLSQYLQNTLGKEKKIALMSNNSLFFVISYFGIIHSGNVCVPLDPSMNEQTLSYIVKDCDITLGFVQHKSVKKWNNIKVKTIDEQHWEDILKIQIKKSETTPYFNSKKLAEIIYTSGSTAQPKGVMISHENIMTNTDSILQYLPIDSDERVCNVLPFFYCYGLSVIHTHVKAGASMVLNNSFILLKTVVEDLLKYKCTSFYGVPSHFQMMLRMSKVFTTSKLPDLRYVAQAGGKLANAFIREFIQLFPDVSFYVMYGQTEATARLSFLDPKLLPEKLGSMGKGIPGVTLEVLNKKGEQVQPGEVGELVASGENIMMGYYHDQQLTDQVLRDEKLYTGDLGTVDEDGYIYITAREKEIIKVAGERVSPKEIEDAIVHMPQVIDCSVIGVDDELLGEAIKTYIVLNRSARKSMTEDDVRS